ncbi:HNH endonuclease [Gordonia polyisoprenivorans]|uniref:HNH endonuclease n=1 Tax=Gordonia polyisoprenivorans TaxID=84595 RepID=UPI002300DAAF|nr:HNH endonuclease [Gordonia polyisoprenivorans]WCB37925.1 HNH endonuclease [Gordonia polyisoprenivorans]
MTSSAQTEWSRQASKRRRIRNRFIAQAKRDGLHCAFCRQPIDPDAPHLDPGELTIDHIVPLSQGGAPFELSNLAAAHRHCNRQAGDKRSTGTFSHEPDSAPPKGSWQLHPNGSIPTEDHPLIDDRGSTYYETSGHYNGGRVYETNRRWW